VATAIPKITEDFPGLDLVSWYSAAFFLTNGGFQSSWGKAYRYFPLKLTFLATVLVFELGSLVCAAAPSSTVFIIGRALNGLGAAGIGTGAYTIIAFITPPNKRAVYTGFVGMSFGVACVVGPLVGGVFADTISWRWCFWVNLPVGGLAALIILAFFHAPEAARPMQATWCEKFLQMDFLGVTLVIGTIVAFMLAMQYGGTTAPWGSGLVIGLLVSFVALAIVFIAWEKYQGERAIMVPRLFGKRAVWVSCGFAGTFVGSYYLVIYVLPIYFQSVGNASPIMSGVYNLPLIIATSISMVLSGAIISATGLAVPLQLIGALLGLIATGLLYTLDTDCGIGKWVGFQLLGGVGWGLAFQIPIIMAQASADPEDISSVTAMVLCKFIPCSSGRRSSSDIIPSVFQCVGPTAFVTAAQTAFVNELSETLRLTAPDVDPLAVVHTGATAIRDVFPAGQVAGILNAYMVGIKGAFAIAVAAAGLGMLVGLSNVVGGKWRMTTEETKDAVVAV
jgi:MFS transporter, DHA2 family, glioxin efflux transporter